MAKQKRPRETSVSRVGPKCNALLFTSPRGKDQTAAVGGCAASPRARSLRARVQRNAQGERLLAGGAHGPLERFGDLRRRCLVARHRLQFLDVALGPLASLCLLGHGPLSISVQRAVRLTQ